MSTPELSADCVLPDFAVSVLGVVLMIGTFLAFFPQFWIVYTKARKKSFSFIRVWLSILGNTCNVSSAIIIFWERFGCCQHMDSWHCFENLLVLLQMFISTSSLILLYFFALLFVRSKTRIYQKARAKLVIRWLAFFMLMLLAGMILAVSLSTCITIDSNSAIALTYAYVIGGIAGVPPLAVWVLVVWTTVRTKSLKSVNLPLLIIQCPGNILVSFYQGIINRALIVGLPSLVVGTGQFLLLLISLYYLSVIWKNGPLRCSNLLPEASERLEENSFFPSPQNFQTSSGSIDTDRKKPRLKYSLLKHKYHNLGSNKHGSINLA